MSASLSPSTSTYAEIDLLKFYEHASTRIKHIEDTLKTVITLNFAAAGGIALFTAGKDAPNAPRLFYVSAGLMIIMISVTAALLSKHYHRDYMAAFALQWIALKAWMRQRHPQYIEQKMRSDVYIADNLGAALQYRFSAAKIFLSHWDYFSILNLLPAFGGIMLIVWHPAKS